MNKQYFLFICLVLVAAVFSCLVLAEPTPKPELGTGLEGVITVGPIHGGPVRVGIPSSKPLANTAFVVKKENETVASFTTDDQGRFRVSLAAGHYAISFQDGKGGFRTFVPFEVDVIAGEMKKVEWYCDTGMR